MKLVVFTTVLGETDPLRRAASRSRGVRYVCLTNHRTLNCWPYESVYVDPEPNGGACLASRRLKILADHPALGDPDVILWHDAAFQLATDPLVVVLRHLAADVDMVAFRHPHRDRIEDEADVIARLGMMPEPVLREQVRTYRDAGFVDQQTITSTGYSIRRCSPAVRAFNELWWSEVASWGYRDQMSVDYAIWRTGLRTSYLPGHYRNNPYARWHPPQRLRRHADLRPAARPAARGAVARASDATAGRVDYRGRRNDAILDDVRVAGAASPALLGAAGRAELRDEPVDGHLGDPSEFDRRRRLLGGR